LWALFSLIAGAIAKFLIPGKVPRGILLTIALGIFGAIVGGFIGRGSFGPSQIAWWAEEIAIVAQE
jgi:uncharacterized membrane protein YeaQ/YmgE (transglycosylase-associated protein family)